MQHGPGPTTATSMHRVLPVAPTTVMQAGVLGPHCHRGNGSTGLGPSLPPNVRRNYLLLQGRETDRDRDIAKKPSFAGAEEVDYLGVPHCTGRRPGDPVPSGLAGPVLSSKRLGPSLRWLQHPGANQEMRTRETG